MRKRIFLIPMLLLLSLLFAGCGGGGGSTGGGETAAVEAAHESAETYYKKLSMNVSEISRNENMDAEVAEFYVNSCLEKYGEGNVMMFDAVTEDEPDVIRHIIMVREDVDSDWTVECEVLDEA